MADIFSSARSTFAWANNHVGKARELCEAFVRNSPWTFAQEQNPDGSASLKIKFQRTISPDLQHVVFDAAQNFRAALDQMAFAIAQAHTGTQHPKSAKFPFSRDAAGLANNIKGGCKDLPPDIQNLFGSLAPHKGGNDVLWGMNELANAKHFSIVPIAVGNLTARFKHIRNMVPTTDSPAQPIYDPQANEITLLKVRTKAGLEPRLEGEFAFEIALDHPEPILGGRPLFELLRNMSSVVEAAIVATERECKRIGLIT